eukprot:1589355-Pyramimonas_sp.AAC.1
MANCVFTLRFELFNERDVCGIFGVPVRFPRAGLPVCEAAGIVSGEHVFDKGLPHLQTPAKTLRVSSHKYKGVINPTSVPYKSPIPVCTHLFMTAYEAVPQYYMQAYYVYRYYTGLTSYRATKIRLPDVRKTNISVPQKNTEKPFGSPNVAPVEQSITLISNVYRGIPNASFSK